MWQLCDLESVNGTYVNDQLLKGCQTLKPGDRISLGRTGPLFIFDWHVNYQKISLTQARKLNQTDSVHLTQLIPILSSQQDLLEKAYLLPGLITVLVVIALFASLSLEDPGLFNNLLGILFGRSLFLLRLSFGRKAQTLVVVADFCFNYDRHYNHPDAKFIYLGLSQYLARTNR